jgi:hypothetical protein
MFEEEGVMASSGAKQAATDFAIMYARKLIRKTLTLNKNAITSDDVR